MIQVIIAFMGLPASGKSFWAKRISWKIKGKRLSSDLLRKKMFKKRTYSESEKEKVYNEMIKQMKINVKKGKNVVLDATFYKEDLRKKFIEQAEKIKQKILFVEVKAKNETLKRRLNKKRKHSEADYAVYLALKSAFEPLKKKHLVVYSDGHIFSYNLKKIMGYIGAGK